MGPPGGSKNWNGNGKKIKKKKIFFSKNFLAKMVQVFWKNPTI